MKDLGKFREHTLYLSKPLYNSWITRNDKSNQNLQRPSMSGIFQQKKFSNCEITAANFAEVRWTSKIKPKSALLDRKQQQLFSAKLKPLLNHIFGIHSKIKLVPHISVRSGCFR